MASIGSTQTIGGKAYTMYSPEWYAAQDANKVHDASVAGEAAGTAAGAAARADYATQHPGYGYPAPDAYTTPPPSLAGLSSAVSRSSGGGGGGGASGGGFLGTTIPGANPSAALSDLTWAAQHMNDPLSATPDNPLPQQVNGRGMADDTAARAAIFARTKDTAANTANASLNGLSEALGSRGLTGGGYEAGQIGGTLAREANTIGEGDRQQAESDLGRADTVADRNYAGQVAQRGQDLQARRDQEQYTTNQAQLQLEQRNASLTGLTAALNGATKRY